MRNIKIGNRNIGANEKCFIIAEAGVNHNGDRELALEMVRRAHEIGADCIKFQTFKAEAVVTAKAPKADYQLKVTNVSESQLEMLQKLELSVKDYNYIIDLCKELDIQFLSTPYNEDDADFLNNLNVNAFKIASGQLVEHSFLKYVASFYKPMIISTGMCSLAEVNEAVEVIRNTGNEDIIVLQCTTNYPSKIEDANIQSMVSMGLALDTIMGYSDHVPSDYACYASIALGAKVLEKHFTLDKNMAGPDHTSSLNTMEFKQLINGIRATELSLGSSIKMPSASEMKNMQGMRRSIVLKKDLCKGSIIKKGDLIFKRPATGIAPNLIDDIVGKILTIDLKADTILQEDHLTS